MKTIRLRITGRVQGVGYRAWVIETARSFGLRGWVRNRADGSVEILATGAEEVLAVLIEACGRGPASARVSEVAIAEDREEGDVGFVARPTE
ncbi:MAG: acylphosphatase [Stellaceae bacterium]